MLMYVEKIRSLEVNSKKVERSIIQDLPTYHKYLYISLDLPLNEQSLLY